MEEEVKHPICPMNQYFEGDEDECNTEKCDYDVLNRSCYEKCKYPIREVIWKGGYPNLRLVLVQVKRYSPFNKNGTQETKYHLEFCEGKDNMGNERWRPLNLDLFKENESNFFSIDNLISKFGQLLEMESNLNRIRDKNYDIITKGEEK